MKVPINAPMLFLHKLQLPPPTAKRQYDFFIVFVPLFSPKQRHFEIIQRIFSQPPSFVTDPAANTAAVAITTRHPRRLRQGRPRPRFLPRTTSSPVNRCVSAHETALQLSFMGNKMSFDKVEGDSHSFNFIK